MPANLTPQYYQAEEEYRRAQSAPERVVCLERMLQRIPRHKGTDRLYGILKAKLKEARQEVQAGQAAAKGGRRYRIPRQGAGTAVIIGAPNSGKSRLLAALTNAQPQIAEFPFTTREPLSGMMPWEDLHVQLIDTPPITENSLEPYLTDFVRTADLVLLTFDGSSDEAATETAEVIRQFSNRKTILSDRSGFDDDDFSIVHVKTLLTVTRGGDRDADTRLELFREQLGIPFRAMCVDLDRSRDVERMRESIFAELEVVRVYTRRPGTAARFVDPFTLPVGGTVEDLALKVHGDLAATLKFAKVWNVGANEGRSVGRDHVLQEGDLVELH